MLTLLLTNTGLNPKSLSIWQADPGLEGVAAVILDEFHERSVEVDTALALCREVQLLLRPELRLVVMSATLGPALSHTLTTLLNVRIP